MLQKFKITSWAFILVLFGFSLMTVSPVLAHNAVAFDEGDHTYEYEEAAVDDAEGTKEALKLQIEEINGWLKDKDARIADLQEQLSTASSELQEKDETIADLTDRFASFEQSQAEFDATIAELEEQLSTASSESQAKDETIADLTDRLAAAMEGSTQGSGAGTASDNKHLNGEGPQEHFWPCTRDNVFGGKKECMVAELTEWRDGCEATFEALSNSWGGRDCRGAMREVGKD